MTWTLVFLSSFIFLVSVLLCYLSPPGFWLFVCSACLLIPILPYLTNILILHLLVEISVLLGSLHWSPRSQLWALLCAIYTFPSGNIYPSDYNCLVTCQYLPSPHPESIAWDTNCLACNRNSQHTLVERTNRGYVTGGDLAFWCPCRHFAYVVATSCWCQIDCFKK